MISLIAYHAQSDHPVTQDLLRQMQAGDSVWGVGAIGWLEWKGDRVE